MNLKDEEIRNQMRAIELENRARAFAKPTAVTQPLFEEADGNRECIASCVLLSVGPHLLVVTAAHALRPHCLYYFGAGDQLLPLRGRRYRTLPPTDEAGSHDFIDLAVTLVEEDSSRLIDRRFVAQLNEIDHGASVDVNAIYLAVGFPYSKQKTHRHKKEIAATNHQILAIREPFGMYAKLGLDPLGNILLHFDKSNVFRRGNVASSPDLHGMSGGSLWKLSPLSGQLTAEPKLAGFLIEWHRRTEKRIIAVRAHVALQLSLELDPSLREWIGSAPRVT